MASSTAIQPADENTLLGYVFRDLSESEWQKVDSFRKNLEHWLDDLQEATVNSDSYKAVNTISSLNYSTFGTFNDLYIDGWGQDNGF